ncbi:MAG: microcin ABC transporter permease [Acidocella sp. 20-57-95]|nr:MAG: microcin ABC transporter permease [Acidocella sp. 20-57-95]OYV62301.1 MAG: microcin ABC transporter permease [Acidocella sp. 21-58-7]HQT63953.1 microcin C ABC transporter permease YejB [Acidocella sp.]HQU03242.1 microcin C ABC transporter permease YejB [Acidocella sp.]
MIRYLAKRVALIIPTLFGIIAINFAVVQFAPGGPVETAMAKVKSHTLQTGDVAAAKGVYRGAQGMDATMKAQLAKQFGFDKPPLTRFWMMLRGYLTFDLGQSFFQGQSVLALVWQRLPISLSLGFWSTLIVYMVSIPLGIRKAVQDGSRFDLTTSLVILTAYAIPGFLLAIFLVVLFGSGGQIPIFPLRGLTSPDAASLPWPARIADYAWHLVLPTIAMTIGGFASLTMLTKNSFLEEIRKLYVLTARAKGASEARVLYGHVFRNAMLLVIAGFPAAFISILFTSALLVEIVFSLNGLGLLGYQAVLQRDYPVMFGTLYIYTLTGLIMQIIGDFFYTIIDPRIDFETRP